MSVGNTFVSHLGHTKHTHKQIGGKQQFLSFWPSFRLLAILKFQNFFHTNTAHGNNNNNKTSNSDLLKLPLDLYLIMKLDISLIIEEEKMKL